MTRIIEKGNRTTRDDKESDDATESPIQGRASLGVGRSRTFTDIKALVNHSNFSTEPSQPVSKGLSLERREKIESGSLDLANKLAALTDNWMSIKHSDLEVIKEYVPDKKADPKVPQPKPISTTAQRKEFLSRKDAIKEIPPSRQKPIEATPKTKSNSGQFTQARSSRAGNFDIKKTMDELDQIKKKVSMSSSHIKPAVKKDSGSGEHTEETNPTSKPASNREIPEKEQEKKQKLESLANRRATHIAAKKTSDNGNQGAVSRHQNMMKNKKSLEDIEAAFSLAIRKVHEFQRDTGSIIRLNEFNKEYAKLIDSLKEVVKKS